MTERRHSKYTQNRKYCVFLNGQQEFKCDSGHMEPEQGCQDWSDMILLLESQREKKNLSEECKQ